MKAITMADVAKKANVSKSTVSQFINERYEFMSAQTKERIKKAVEELNYMPNSVARSLTQKRTSTIGVIVANILHSFSTQVIRSIEDVCNKSDVHVIVCNADDDPEKERNYIEMLKAKQVDGLIIFPTGGNVELYKKMVMEKYPLVFVDRMVEDSGVSTILLDNEKASELLVNHLCENDYRRIAFITTSLERQLTPRMERLQGYKKGLKKNSLPYNEKFCVGARKSQIQESLQTMFAQDPPPDSLVCGNDLSLLEAMKFIRKKGLKVPADVGLVSIDEVPYSEVLDPTLTVVAQPAFEMGADAADLLLKKIEETEEVVQGVVRYSPELIVRKST